MKIYFIIADCGDGSCTVEWFKDRSIAEKLLDEDSPSYREEYFMNDGVITEVDVPEGWDTGVRFQDERYRS